MGTLLGAPGAQRPVLESLDDSTILAEAGGGSTGNWMQLSALAPTNAVARQHALQGGADHGPNPLNQQIRFVSVEQVLHLLAQVTLSGGPSVSPRAPGGAMKTPLGEFHMDSSRPCSLALIEHQLLARGGSWVRTYHVLPRLHHSVLRRQFELQGLPVAREMLDELLVLFRHVLLKPLDVAEIYGCAVARVCLRSPGRRSACRRCVCASRR